MSTFPTFSSAGLPATAAAVVPGSTGSMSIIGGGGGGDFVTTIPPVGSIAPATPIVPMGVATPALPVPPGAGGANALAGSLGALMTLLMQLIATASAQLGATTAAGGGGAAAAPTTGAALLANASFTSGNIGGGGNGNVNIASYSNAGSLGGGGSGAAWSNALAPTGVIGGGSSATGGSSGPGISGVGATIGGAGLAQLPTVEVPTTAGSATATPIFDTRRLTGTPQAGGAIDLAMRSANPMAVEATSEGAWIVLTDGNGAQLQVHAHGIWAPATPDQIAAGIQAGRIQVHLHPDGTLHLHDYR